MTVAAVDIRDASLSLGRRVIWQGVTVNVEPGEFVAVLDPNGVGKSTLIKAILGLLPINIGKITVLGRSPRDARHNIGYLPQRRSFDPGIRIRGVDVVRMGLDGDRWGVPFTGATR